VEEPRTAGSTDRTLASEVHRRLTMPRMAKNSSKLTRAQSHSRGFTLLELVVVVSIIMIFMSIAIPMYNRSVLRARESLLKSNLNTLNSAIFQYTLDKKKAPQSIDDLKTAGYIEKIPEDPMTRGTDWEVEQDDDIVMSVDQQDPGIIGVHSASNAIGSDGTAYSSW
jgi:general secretion pathway protein G